MIDVWDTLESAFPKIIGYLREAEKDLPEHPIQAVDGWQGLMDFLLFENQAINGAIVTENLLRRAYMNPDTMNLQYQNLAKHGYVSEFEGLFTITDKGREAYIDFFAQRAGAYEKVTILANDDFDTFIKWLKKGYEAGKAATVPEYKPSMRIGYQFYTSIGGGQPGTLLGWINLFELYRDDVHAYVWKKAGYTGIQIESLTKIWRDEVHNASELAEQLSARGYVEADYQTALDDLVAQGKLQLVDNHYRLSDDALSQRQQIEEETNQIFDDFCNTTYSEAEFANLERIIIQIKG